jgi:aminocarboxymuconate-semialdehyde decarboxylase
VLKIDIHTHILPASLPRFKDRFGYGGFIELQCVPGCNHVNMVSDEGVFFRKVEPNCFDPHERIKECDHHGVDVQVLSTVPVMFSYWTKPQDGLTVAKFLNDDLARVVSDHPKRFVGLGTLPMQDAALSVQELERCIGQLGLRGVQIGSNINGVNLDDERFFPVYEALEHLGAALFIHPWEMMGEKQMQKYWLPWLVGMPAETSRAICSMLFGGVFQRFPQLKVAFAHGGGAFPMTIGRIQHGFDVRPDLCAIDTKVSPRDQLGSFYLDTLVHDPKVLHYLLDLVGPERLCLGTDYPFPLGELTPGQVIEEAKVSDETKAWLLHRSALTWLGMDQSFFKT